MCFTSGEISKKKKNFPKRSLGKKKKKAIISDYKGLENETGIHTNIKNTVRKCQGKVMGLPDKVENK